MKEGKVLFVDDLESARKLFLRLMESTRFEALVAPSVTAAEEEIRREKPNVVVTDLRMPEVDGLAGLERFHAIDPDMPVILVTAFGTVETAVEAMRRGAFDYIRKPFEPSEIEIVIERAIQHRDLLQENANLRTQVERRFSRDNVICASAAMQAVLDLVDRVAQTDFAVLVDGASGTGKDVISRLIHNSSPRAKSVFISINCSAIPEHLLESELFGYEKGAFSGATSSKVGFFSQADGGTLFLDEIGDMSLSLQPKLLHVLQNGEFYAVGSRQLSTTDVRVICASNQDIPALVEQRRFREDLYYRINTVCIHLPSLRERTEEIPLMVEHFLAVIKESSPRAPTTVSKAAMRRLLEYPWPGNVRELEHALARASLVCDSGEIGPEDLAPEIRGNTASKGEVRVTAFRNAREDFERSYFHGLLAETKGNIQRAAEIAGIHRTTLYEKLSKLGIELERT